MIELFSFEFIRNALIASILVSIASGIVGTLVVVNRLSFIAGGVAHAAYGGLGLAAFLGWSPMAGTIPFSLASSLLIGFISRNQKERADTIIGVVWAAGMAIGIILIDLKPGYFTDLMSYLFGSIMAVSGSSLLWMAILDIFVILLICFFFKEILAMSYDPEFASIRGIPVRFFYYLILCMVALTVVLLIKAVGLILVIALFTIPASIAELFTNNLRRMMIWSILLGCIFTGGGILAAYFLDLTAGATIIMFACFVYGISYGVKKVRNRKRR
jgi:zinc transport system permease protein